MAAPKPVTIGALQLRMYFSALEERATEESRAAWMMLYDGASNSGAMQEDYANFWADLAAGREATAPPGLLSEGGEEKVKPLSKETRDEICRIQGHFYRPRSSYDPNLEDPDPNDTVCFRCGEGTV